MTDTFANPLKLNIIVGSTRPGRAGPAIATWFDAIARQGAFEVELVDLADFNLPLFDEPAHPMSGQYAHDHTRRWSRSVASADAFVFVTPEYDQFPPASLVNALQVLLHEWSMKPAAIVSYGGPSGGMRSGQSLRHLLGSLNMMALPKGVALQMYFQHLAQDGVFRPGDQAGADVETVLADLYRWAEVLRLMRGQNQSLVARAA